MSFFSKFNGYNDEVSKTFAYTFDGECAKVVNLTIHLSEHVMPQVTSLSQEGKRCFKNRQLKGKPWTPFIKKSRTNPNWVRGMPNSWLKHTLD
jgi:hypothetical protein